MQDQEGDELKDNLVWYRHDKRSTTIRTVWAKKSKPQIFVHIFANYWPIFTILSPTHSVENL